MAIGATTAPIAARSCSGSPPSSPARAVAFSLRLLLTRSGGGLSPPPSPRVTLLPDRGRKPKVRRARHHAPWCKRPKLACLPTRNGEEPEIFTQKTNLRRGPRRRTWHQPCHTQDPQRRLERTAEQVLVRPPNRPIISTGGSAAGKRIGGATVQRTHFMLAETLFIALQISPEQCRHRHGFDRKAERLRAGIKTLIGDAATAFHAAARKQLSRAVKSNPVISRTGLPASAQLQIGSFKLHGVCRSKRIFLRFLWPPPKRFAENRPFCRRGLWPPDQYRIETGQFKTQFRAADWNSPTTTRDYYYFLAPEVLSARSAVLRDRTHSRRCQTQGRADYPRTLELWKVRVN